MSPFGPMQRIYVESEFRGWKRVLEAAVNLISAITVVIAIGMEMAHIFLQYQGF
jgi:hypothetical protein